MTQSRELSRDAFLRMAESVGLDIQDAHMEELYFFVQNVLKSIEPLDELDLSNMEPDFQFVPR